LPQVSAAQQLQIKAQTRLAALMEEKLVTRISVLSTLLGGGKTTKRLLVRISIEVYRAFTTADAMARWLPPNGFTCTVHQLDSKVGGTYRMSFTNFTTGKTHSFGGKYLDLVPDELIRYTDRFEDPNLLGEMITTVTLRPVSVGTEVNIVQEGLPAAIPLEACYLGWQQSLNHLATLVEPEIKD
jgi:uncharacterized protein YndB with AHSA1/START domain